MVEFLTHEELKDYFLTIKHAVPCTITTMTIPEMRKTHNPYFGKIKKVVKDNNVFIGYNYGRSVNRQRVKEGLLADFIPQSRKWGERLFGTPLVFYKDKWYLEVRYLRDLWPIYLYNDKPIYSGLLLPYLIDPPIPYRQGIKKNVICKDYCLTSIQEIVINKHEFVIGEHPDE